MTQNDKPAFIQILKSVHDFYGSDMSTFSVGIWWKACSCYPLERVSKAFDKHLLDTKSGQFMPKPADIVRALQGTHEDRSMIAWGKVFDAIQRVGQYQSVVFDDPAIHAVITDMGGWSKLCATEMDELPFVQKRFCDFHAAYGRSGEFEYPRIVYGSHDTHNARLGMEPRNITLVGDIETARLVMERGTAGPKTRMQSIGHAALLAIGNEVRE